VPGTLAKIVLLRSGVASASVDVPYVATITRLSVSTGPASGGTVVAVTGKGFAGSSTWALKGSDGSTVASLPTVSSLDGVSSGVVVLSDTRVAVRMPALGSAFGTVVLAFTPDQALYPGAASAFTSQAVFTYSDLG
jgi:hypothetical protein